MVAESSFFKLFGQSPFRALQEHSNIVRDCVRVLPDLFSSLFEGETDASSKSIDRILDLESKADKIKNELRTHLPKNLLLPVDRRDLLEILDLQDTIADKSRETAAIFRERKMELPAALKEPFGELLARCLDACDQANAIINELDELIATGFRGRESDIVSAMIEELSRIETDAEQLKTDLARRLFSLESEMEPISVIIWHDIIKLIGGVADYSEKVGNRVRLLIAR